MAGLLGIGISALNSTRLALETTGHNITNVNTPGYSRQEVSFSAQSAGITGAGSIGAGVAITSIQRITDEFAIQRAQGSIANFEEADTLSSIADRVDKLMSDDSTGLAGPLRDFLDGLDVVTADPTNVEARVVFLEQTRTLDSRVNALRNDLDRLGSEVDRRIQNVAVDINSKVRSIADLNNRIVLDTRSGIGPSDLLDQRDQLVNELAELIGVSTVQQADGSLNVFTGTGQGLVVGQQTAEVSARPNSFGELDVFLGDNSIGRQISGGQLSGLLDARADLIDPARDQLGRVVYGITSVINAQQAQGNDLDGNPGADLFDPMTPAVIERTNNTGGALGTASFAGVTATADGFATDVVAREYNVTRDSGAFVVTDARSGEVIPATGSGTAADPLVFEGIEFSTDIVPADGDAFRVQPYREAGLELLTADPRAIASAALTEGPNSSDNSNVLAMTEALRAGLFNGGTESIQNANASSIVSIGTVAREADVFREAQQSLLESDRSYLESIAGVNLDEEAANLLKFQQAYQAAARVMSTADTVFNALLQATS